MSSALAYFCAECHKSTGGVCEYHELAVMEEARFVDFTNAVREYQKTHALYGAKFARDSTQKLAKTKARRAWKRAFRKRLQAKPQKGCLIARAKLPPGAPECPPTKYAD
jgi:hypothetical protein